MMAGIGQRLSTRWLPFADAASDELPLSRILRLALFQVSIGMTTVLLTGTLNRVMIVELGVSSSLVAIMIALPLVFAPLRAMIGHQSDNHRSVLGWRRAPYIWFGTLMMFGGFAILPFALLIMSGGAALGSVFLGQAGAAFAFLLVGAGMHMAQTAGLALATDLAPADKAPRVVALLYVMLLLGTIASAVVIGQLLNDFSATRLVQVVQGCALVTMILNVAALWKQEPRIARPHSERPPFRAVWAHYIAQTDTKRLLIATGLGAAAFAMQDVLLEPYGGQALAMTVGATTALTAFWALGMVTGFALAARALTNGRDPHALAGHGGVAGIAAFLAIIFSAPAQSVALLTLGGLMLGLGSGLFAVGTMTAAMASVRDDRSGLSLGAWGAVQASCAGVAIGIGGVMRDVIAASEGAIAGYSAVFLTEIILLLAMLIAIGPLVGRKARAFIDQPFGMAEFPA
jgi:MFS transporter, BCD family, chlorophyll transporter